MTTATTGAARKQLIGRRLRELRGMRSIEGQAKKMRLSRQRYGEWEKGEIPDSVLAFVLLAESEGVSLDEILLNRNGGPS